MQLSRSKSLAAFSCHKSSAISAICSVCHFPWFFSSLSFSRTIWRFSADYVHYSAMAQSTFLSTEMILLLRRLISLILLASGFCYQMPPFVFHFIFVVHIFADYVIHSRYFRFQIRTNSIRFREQHRRNENYVIMLAPLTTVHLFSMIHFTFNATLRCHLRSLDVGAQTQSTLTTHRNIHWMKFTIKSLLNANSIRRLNPRSFP